MVDPPYRSDSEAKRIRSRMRATTLTPRELQLREFAQEELISLPILREALPLLKAHADDKKVAIEIPGSLIRFRNARVIGGWVLKHYSGGMGGGWAPQQTESTALVLGEDEQIYHGVSLDRAGINVVRITNRGGTGKTISQQLAEKSANANVSTLISDLSVTFPRPAELINIINGYLPEKGPRLEHIPDADGLPQ